MKKTIIFIIIISIIVIGILYSTYGTEFLHKLDEKKVYSIEKITAVDINTLDGFKFYKDGIITYNNQKIKLIDYSNNKIWENLNKTFPKQVFVTDNNIYRNMGNNIESIDRNNESFVIAGITGDIINVSRENEQTYLIIKNTMGQNSLYIIDDSNEILVENKVYEDIITGVSISDKSEGYSLITLNLENGLPKSTIYFNLLDDVELWGTSIENEILLKTQIVNNNVIAIGAKNIYYYNTNGKLMWKNSIYNKILDCKVDKENKKIYMLYDKDSDIELISYNFQGKVMEVQKLPSDAKKMKIYDSKVFVYNENVIYVIHGSKTDKIYEDKEENIADFMLDGNAIRILFVDKLIKGQIK